MHGHARTDTDPAAPRGGLVVVLGPTASGKTRVGVALARAFGGEIISADSRQVYRGLDIGAGKDLAEYRTGGPPVAHHLIDVAVLSQEFSVFEYQQQFYAVFEALSARGVLPVVVGGTGLYLEAVLSGYRMVEVPENPALREALAGLSMDALTARLKELKPALHNTTDLTGRARLVRAIEIALHSRDHAPPPAPPIRPLVLGIRWDRATLRARIAARLADRLDHGLIEEVEALLAAGVPRETLEFLGLEYRYVLRHLDGIYPSRDALFDALNTAIAQFAKRQETWFRRMERRGTVIHWLDGDDVDEAVAAVATWRRS